MKKINLILILVLFALSFLASCQSIKDGLSGRKSENSDEFLVQKKNPLVTPPDFMKLPMPNESQISEASKVEDETDIQKLLKIENIENKVSTSKSGKAEDFVLKNLNK